MLSPRDGGSRGSVQGYSVGGKTGTSEPPKEDVDFGYVASFVAVSPADNPEIVVLVALYNPQNGNASGGRMAGPVVSKILSEVLPYLGISADKIDIGTTTSSNSFISVPDVQNKTVTEAQKVLTNAGFRTQINTTGNKNEVLVSEQVPTKDTMLPNNSLVVLYTENDSVRTSTTVPDLNGLTASQAADSLKAKNLNISIEGSGLVVSQDPPNGTSVEQGSVVKITLQNQ